MRRATVRMSMALNTPSCGPTSMATTVRLLVVLEKLLKLPVFAGSWCGKSRLLMAVIRVPFGMLQQM
jgi:hypothetical protein